LHDRVTEDTERIEQRLLAVFPLGLRCNHLLGFLRRGKIREDEGGIGLLGCLVLLIEIHLDDLLTGLDVQGAKGLDADEVGIQEEPGLQGFERRRGMRLHALRGPLLTPYPTPKALSHDSPLVSAATGHPEDGAIPLTAA